MGSPESAAQLLAVLRSDDAQLRTGALDALRIMAGAVRDLLPRLLQDPDSDVRLLCCELARSLPSADATSLLCALLAAEREINVCAAAVEVLAEVGGPEALTALAECGQRFRDAPFLGFAIKIATDRINSQSAPTRG
jgi:HEAT repeat protein